MFDTLIKNGTIVDGIGTPAYNADLAIKDGKIVKIGTHIEEMSSNEVIDATGKIVSPGFIDIHNHSDTTILAAHMVDSFFMQGVTTVLGGQCGFSPAPVKDEKDLKQITDWLAEWNMHLTWHSFKEYLDTVENAGPGINFGCLVGHGAIRTYVMGFENRTCTKEELEEMKLVLAKALDDGALGFSTGLEYMPGQDASREEILELCKVVSQKGKLYATHQRNRDFKFAESLDEAIDTARSANVSTQISHTAPRYWTPGERVGLIKKKIEAARVEGLNVDCDYITVNDSTFYLISFLPKWIFDEGPEKLKEYLNDPSAREKIKEYKDHMLYEIVRRKAWDTVILSGCINNKSYIGMNFSEIAKAMGHADPYDAVMDIVRDECPDYLNIAVLIQVTDDNDLEELIPMEYAFPESDIWGVSKFGRLANNVMSAHTGYDWIIRYLQHFIRDRKVLSLEEGIRRLTSLPAKKIGLHDRGTLAVNQWADIVVFDYEKLKSNSTHQNPNQYPDGFEHVLINGVFVAKDGKPTGLCGGKVLRW